jgi:dihydrofolate reductase
MRKIIAFLQVSVDGFIEGPNREVDWMMIDDDEEWREINEMLDSVDALILGGGMYPGYEQYWLALLTNPAGGTTNQSSYAQRADKIPHFVLSKTLDKAAWKTTRIVRDLDEIRMLKEKQGKNILAWGGATFVSSLMNKGLLDEVRLMVNPIILGGGKALFKDVKERQSLKLLSIKPLKSGMVILTYST